jgi:hypothetical protein
MCNKALKTVERAETGITKIMLSDANIRDKLKTLEKAPDAGTEELDFIAENFAEKIASEYPILKKYVDVDKLIQNDDLKQKLSSISGAMSDADAIKSIVQTTISGFTDSIKSKIKSVRRKMLIPVILLQALCFGITFYRAGKYRSPATGFENIYQSNNDYL